MITRQEKNKNLLLLAAVLIFTAVVFLPSLRNDFINWDDTGHIVENLKIRSLSWGNVQKIFSETVNRTYIPLTILSFAGQYQLNQLDPYGYHLGNFILHLLVTALVYFLAIRLSGSPLAAWGAAILFGIHPMHVEAVAWVTARKDTLYSVFYLASLHSYLSYLEKGGRKYFLGSIVCAALSLLAKPMALSLPLILFLLDYFKKRPLSRKVFIEKIPYALFFIPIVWITYRLNARIPIQDAGESILIWAWAYSFYIWKFLFPAALVPLYTAPEHVSWANPIYAGSAVFFIASIVAIYLFRKNRWVTFAFLYYFLSIFFLLRFDTQADLSIVADRFMYLPSFGFCLLAGVGLNAALNSARHNNAKLAVVFGFAILVFVLAQKTVLQCGYWKNSVALWSAVLEKFPMQVAAYNNRGLAYVEIENYPAAMADYNKGIAINPQYQDTFVNRANLHRAFGRHDEALRDYSSALALDEKIREAYLNRGMVYFAKKMPEKALEDFSKALEVDPMYAQAYNNRGILHDVQGDHTLALADYQRAIELNPYFEEAYNNRGVVYFAVEEYEAAVKDFSRAIELKPNYAEGYNNRGKAYEMLGQHREARRDYEQALKFKPSYLSAQVNLERALAAPKP